jgi:hypothetical protein
MLLTPDEKLIHAILQAGLQGYFDARRTGVNADALFEEARPVWGLMEELAKLNRLPSLTEIQLKTGLQIDQICQEPIDVKLASDYIVKRGLSGQLNTKLADLFRDDAVNKDPFAVRKKLVEVYQETAWGLGAPLSINSRDAIDQFKRAYDRAASAAGGLLGMSSPWPTVDSASLGLQPGELTVCFAKRKIGKCIAADTVLHCPDTGAERTIAELHHDVVNDQRRLGWDVLTWKKNSPIYRTTPSDFMDVGEKECVEVVYRSGRSMTIGLEHPMLTPRGWAKAQDLIAGHHTASVSKVTPPSAPDKRMLDCEIKFLAYMIADGGCSKASTPTWTKNDPVLVDEMRACLDTMDCDLKPAVNAPGHYYVTGRGGQHTPVALSLLRHHGLMEKKSIEKTIPPRVFSLDDHQLGLFLGRLWSGDGSIEASGMVSYSTGSQKMALQIQHLLLRFGVTSRVRTRNVNGQDYYEIYVHRRCLERFQTHIKLIGLKAEKLQQVDYQGVDKVGFIKTEELADLIEAEFDKNPGLLGSLTEELGYQFQMRALLGADNGRIRRKHFEIFCEIYNSELKWILDENIWWDEIVSITPVGKKQCYDFSIPETECYVANDYIVHNSWIVIVWAVHMWRRDLKPGEKVLFVTMEMTELQIMRRMACVDLRLPWDDLRKGKLTMHQKNLLDEWCEQRRAEEGDPTKANIIFATSKECRDAKDIGALVAEHRPKAVVVDSFYILGREDNKSIYERVLGNVQALKLDVALQYNVPVLASTQLKGTVDKDTLNADSDDAMGAKAIGDYADVTRGLFADEELWAASKRYWRGMEAREFKAKDVEINFNFETMNFDEVREILPEDEKAEAEEKEKEKEGKGFRSGSGGKKKPAKSDYAANVTDVPPDISVDIVV